MTSIGSSCDSDGGMMMGSDCIGDGEGITIWWYEIKSDDSYDDTDTLKKQDWLLIPA